MKKSKKIIVWLVVFLIVLITSIVSMLYLEKENKVVTVITMDINPSLKISLNEKEKVVKVEGLNKDGKELLKDNKLKGKSLEIAIEKITDKAIEKNYVKEKDSHILLYVKGEKTKEEVTTIINNELKEQKVECEVITQVLSEDSKENASKYEISESKASYIESIIKENQDKEITVTFEELKDKSISEIEDFVKEKEEQKKKEEEEKKKQEEEQKRKEEEEKKKQEEANKKPSSSTGNSTTQKPSGGGTGTVAVCSRADFVLENDDATDKVLGYLGLTKDRLWYNYQTIAHAYNGICCYQTKIIHNKRMYTYYHNVTTGVLVHKEDTSYLAGNYEDIKEIVENYFVTNYGASKEEVSLTSSGGTLNEENKEATVKYNGATYEFIIDQKTGAIKSVKQK